MLVLKNSYLQVEVNPFGAELSSIVDLATQKEYIWQGVDPWPRRAPVLFPIVGRLKDDQYQWQGIWYRMGQHGFARNSEFRIVLHSANHIKLRLSPSEFTREIYPFDFQFDVSFTLEGRSLVQTFSATNMDELNIMPVSFGAHPAFNVSPLENYEICFDEDEQVRSQTVANGIRYDLHRQVIEGNRIRLTRHIFDDDALIFSGLKSKSLTIAEVGKDAFIKIDFESFPYLGIWAKPATDFVCIEPWEGIADDQNHNGDIEKKEGITLLKGGEALVRSFTISLI